MIQESLPEFDPRTPADARVYGFLIGGKDSLAVDRDVAESLLLMEAKVDRWRMPAVENRRFMKRAVRFFVKEGLTQILDLGCGMPTRANVHQLARVVNEEVKVAYVDYDPVVISHYRALVHGLSDTVVVQEDVRHPERVLNHPEITSLLDFDRPVGVLMAGLLHLIRDDEGPGRIVAHVREAMVPGSLLAVSCLTSEGPAPHALSAFRQVFQQVREPLVLRSRTAIRSFLHGFEQVEPGMVDAAAWRPERPELRPSGWIVAGVARRP